jgi:hypothetical protein
VRWLAGAAYFVRPKLDWPMRHRFSDQWGRVCSTALTPASSSASSHVWPKRRQGYASFTRPASGNWRVIATSSKITPPKREQRDDGGMWRPTGLSLSPARSRHEIHPVVRAIIASGRVEPLALPPSRSIRGMAQESYILVRCGEPLLSAPPRTFVNRITCAIRMIKEGIC